MKEGGDKFGKETAVEKKGDPREFEWWKQGEIRVFIFLHANLAEADGKVEVRVGKSGGRAGGVLGLYTYTWTGRKA